MDFSLTLLTFAMLWKLSSSIRCYRCDPERHVHNVGIPLCEHFDGSDQFIIECNFSTMCVKKETSLRNFEAETRSVERNCALQTRDDEQVKIDGRWQYVKPIHEIYKETCEEESGESGMATRTTHCYCRGHLCNSARSITISFLSTILMGALWIVLK